MSGKILFLTLPYPSHQIPCFELAKDLRDEGNNIFFSGHLPQKELIEKEGFLFESFQYVQVFKVANFKIFISLLIKSFLDKGFKRKNYREFYSTFIFIRNFLIEKKISRVYLDSAIVEYETLIIPFCTDIKIIFTGLSNKRSFAIPPQNSDFIPSGSFLSNMYCEVLWLKKNILTLCHRIIDVMALGNRGSEYFFRRFRKKTDLKQVKPFQPQELILAPEILEFPCRKVRINETYYHKPRFVKEESYSKEYEDILKKVNDAKKNHYQIVYCSLGTLNWIFQKEVEAFYDKLIQAIENRSSLFLVISSGTTERRKDISDKVIFSSFLPQRNFLKYTDLMINHAGMGSIKDCLDQQIPFICCPLNYNVDQPGNAARVVYHNLGCRIILRKATVKEINQKIENFLPFRN